MRRDPAFDQSCAASVLAHLILPRRRPRPPAYSPRPRRRRAPRSTRNRSREGQPCPAVAAVAAPVGRHRCQPRVQRPAPGHQLLGQHCCPNRPCQILPRHTRLVHAGFGRTFRFVAAAPSYQARRGPRAGRGRNAVAPFAPCRIARRVNRLTVVAGKSRRNAGVWRRLPKNSTTDRVSDEAGGLDRHSAGGRAEPPNESAPEVRGAAVCD